MRRLHIDEITGEEVLSKDIVSDTDATLMIAGTIIKREYAQKLKALNIEYVYVKDSVEKDDNVKLHVDVKDELKVRKECQDKVREIVEKYASYGIEQLSPIVSIADSIIEDVLNHDDVIYNMANIRDKNETIFSHSVNVCVLSIIIAVQMKMSSNKVKEIAIGCLLHDIGYTYYTDRIDISIADINKEMCDELKKHVIYGYSIVNAESWISQVAKNVVLSHHERIDGSGYPFGLVGKKIKKEARIVAVCDTFDRLVHGDGKKKYKVYEAIDYIDSQSNVLFDKDVVDAFLNTVAAYPKGAIVVTSEGEKGIVIRQNNKYPTRPVIRIIESKTHKQPMGDVVINLMEVQSVFIIDSDI